MKPVGYRMSMIFVNTDVNNIILFLNYLLHFYVLFKLTAETARVGSTHPRAAGRVGSGQLWSVRVTHNNNSQSLGYSFIILFSLLVGRIVIQTTVEFMQMGLESADCRLCNK